VAKSTHCVTKFANFACRLAIEEEIAAFPRDVLLQSLTPGKYILRCASLFCKRQSTKQRRILMKTKNKIALILWSALILSTGAAEAHGSTVDTALGGALGGAAGAVIGQRVGGRDGAIIGGALGAATGVYIVNDRGRRVEYVPARVEYVPATVYVAPRPVIYYGPPGYYISQRARGHGYWQHHGHHHDHDDWGDRHEWHEDHDRHHWD
jgi:hypothetical protein